MPKAERRELPICAATVPRPNTSSMRATRATAWSDSSRTPSSPDEVPSSPRLNPAVPAAAASAKAAAAAHTSVLRPAPAASNDSEMPASSLPRSIETASHIAHRPKNRGIAPKTRQPRYPPSVPSSLGTGVRNEICRASASVCLPKAARWASMCPATVMYPLTCTAPRTTSATTAPRMVRRCRRRKKRAAIMRRRSGRSRGRSPRASARGWSG